MKLNEKEVIKELYEAPDSEIETVSVSDVIATSPLIELGENETSPYIGLEELW